MANLTLRTVKGSALTYSELDTNFINLNDQLEHHTHTASDLNLTGAASSILANNLTPNVAVVSNSSGKISTLDTISTTELGYLNGVTSAIQTQIDSKQASLGFTPIQQGGGTNQGANKIYIGWNQASSSLYAQVDATNFSNMWPINVTGSAATATYATSAGAANTATNATYATSAGSATYATSAGAANTATNATYATSAGSATTSASADIAQALNTSNNYSVANMVASGSYVVAGSNATYNFGIIHDSSGNFNISRYTKSNVWNATLGYMTSDGHLFSVGSMRAPVFYDSFDSSYFVDPNQQSILYGLSIKSSAPTIAFLDVNHTNFYVHANSNLWYVLNSSQYAAMYVDQNGNFTAAGDVSAYSDIRLKSYINTIKNPIDTVKQLRGVTFQKGGRPGIGLIAQEVESVLPEVVHHDEKSGYLSLAYGNLVGVLIEAIKEQQIQIDELNKKVNSLIQGK